MLSQESKLSPNATGLLKVKFESVQSLIFHLYPVGLRVSIFLNGKEKLGFIENKNPKGSRKCPLLPSLHLNYPRKIASYPFQQRGPLVKHWDAS